MRKQIKRYILNNGVTDRLLQEKGFKRGGFISDLPNPKYFYNKSLYGDIELHVEVVSKGDGTFFFDDYYCVYVIDDSFGQPYYPFYDEKQDFAYLNTVIDKYNQAMDKLIEKGILESKEIEEEKIKTLKK